MKVTFWGTRGSIAAPGADTVLYGGNTCCVEIRLQSGRTIIIDSGTGIRLLGDHLMETRDTVDVHLLMTHVHWDHVQGFPFFEPAYHPSTRIVVDGCPAAMRGLRVIFDRGLGDGFFPVSFENLPARFEHARVLERGSLQLDDVLIDKIPLNHPQGGFGYRLREDNKVLVFITDNELSEEARKGCRTEDYVRFCQGAHMLVHDAQFTPQEIQHRRGWGHSDFAGVVDLGIQAQVERLILFHHCPTRKDQELAQIENHCNNLIQTAGSSLEIRAAREGDELTL